MASPVATLHDPPQERVERGLRLGINLPSSTPSCILLVLSSGILVCEHNHMMVNIVVGHRSRPGLQGQMHSPIAAQGHPPSADAESNYYAVFGRPSTRVLHHHANGPGEERDDGRRSRFGGQTRRQMRCYVLESSRLPCPILQQKSSSSCTRALSLLPKESVPILWPGSP